MLSTLSTNFLILWGYCLTAWENTFQRKLTFTEKLKKKKKVYRKAFLNTYHPTDMLFTLAAKSPFYAEAPLFNVAHNFRPETSVLSHTSFIFMVSLILEDEVSLSIISKSIIFWIQFYYSSRDSVRPTLPSLGCCTDQFTWLWMWNT